MGTRQYPLTVNVSNETINLEMSNIRVGNR